MVLDIEDNKITSLPPEFCTESQKDWMNGEVGLQMDLANGGCDAIACRPGFWSPQGKAVSLIGLNCEPCPANQYYGETACEVDGLTKSREAEILDSLFSATGGRYWSQNANWTKPGVPICFREGVECDDTSDEMNSGVVRIDLDNFQLRGRIPSDIFELPSVRELSFDNNPVDIDLNGIESATNLQALYLKNTDLRSLDGIEMAPPQLLYVDASWNHMDGPFPYQRK